MGSPKAALELPNGEIMGERASRLLSLLCRDVVLLGEAENLSAGTASLPLVPDRRPGLGPLGGLEALLESGRDETYLVLPCDLPLMLPSLLHRLTGLPEGETAVFRLAGEERFEPFPLLLPARALSVLRERLDNGELGVRRFLDRIGLRIVDVPPHRAHCFRNVNRPADLADPLFRRNLFTLS